MEKFTVMVGFTVSRPIIVDEMVSFVTILADSDREAELLSAQMVGTRAEMVTSTKIMSVEI